MSNAILAIGTLLRVGDGADPENFATISEVRSIAGPDRKMDVKDVTNHSSPGRTREKLGVLKDPGTLKFEINWQPREPTHNDETGLLADHDNFTRRNYQLVQPDDAHSTVHIKGMVTEIGASYKVDDVMMNSIGITIVQQPTYSHS